MDSHRLSLTRRGLMAGTLGMMASVAVSGCAPQTVVGDGTASASRRAGEALSELERETGVLIGVAAGTGARATVSFRGRERFPMCSLFKTLTVAELLRGHAYDEAFWSQRIAVDPAEVVENSPVTSRNAPGSMSVDELADAALRYSDNTAGNLLLRLLGGPEALTVAVADAGARHTRLDRWEPELNEAVPGDERDTSTPEDIFGLYGDALCGRRLDRLGTARLQSWMLRNTTSDERIRAALPAGAELADKTGAGAYGVVNDAGVAWSGDRAVTMAIMTRTDDASSANRNDVVRRAAEVVWQALR